MAEVLKWDKLSRQFVSLTKNAPIFALENNGHTVYCIVQS